MDVFRRYFGSFQSGAASVDLGLTAASGKPKPVMRVWDFTLFNDRSKETYCIVETTLPKAHIGSRLDAWPLEACSRPGERPLCC